MYRMGGWGFICGGLLLLLVLAALVVLAVLALRAYSRGTAGRAADRGPMGGAGPGTPDQPVAPGSGRALEILRERYARGEITKEQFDAMRQDILG
jgi:putative membrane protein